MSENSGENSGLGHAGVLHRLRSSLARAQAEAELLGLDGAPASRTLDAIADALTQLSTLEDALLHPIDKLGRTLRVVVIDDDARLAEITATRLQRRGIAALT